MPPEPATNFLAVSRKQLIVVAVLAVTLVSVVTMNFSGEANSPGPTRPKRPRGSRPAAGSRAERAADQGSTPGAWPIVRLAEVLRHNPFAMPPELVEPLEASSQAAPATAADGETENAGPDAADPQDQLAKYRVTAIVGSRQKGYVAIVGSQTIRPGDKLDGFRVVAVGPDGILLDLNFAE